MAKLARKKVTGPLKHDKQRVRQINFQVLPRPSKLLLWGLLQMDTFGNHLDSQCYENEYKQYYYSLKCIT